MTDQSQALIAIKIKEIYPRLMNYGVYLTKNRTEAEDLVQDTIKKVLEKKESWNDISNFTAWSITILRNRFLDKKKKKTETQLLPNQKLKGQNKKTNRKNIEQRNDKDIELDPGMADERLNQEMIILFDECLKKLGEDRAELILMNAIQGMTTAAISKILKTSQNTILTWLTKAKFELKDCINFG